MFERYTERARRSLFFARYEASRLGSFVIDTEHLLLGVLRDGRGVSSRVFARWHVTYEDVLETIEGRTTFREKLSTSVEIPFSGEAKHALQCAAEEADRLLHSYIGTEHLLLGLLRDERSAASSILLEKGMRLDTVRDEIVLLVNEKTTPVGGDETQHPATITPSYELHVRESVGTGAQVTASGPDYWSASNFTLREVIAMLFAVDDDRVELPPQFDRPQRYVLAMRLPAPEPRRAIEMRVRQEIEHYFGVSVTRDTREQDVIVVVRPSAD